VIVYNGQDALVIMHNGRDALVIMHNERDALVKRVFRGMIGQASRRVRPEETPLQSVRHEV
jgi:hypothetical protein